MAQSMIRLDDEVYTEIKKRADTQGRSYANLVNYYLKKEFGWLPGQSNGEPFGEVTPDTTVDDLIKEAPGYDVEVAEKQLSGELNCCLNDQRPCKHWVWDIISSIGIPFSSIINSMQVESLPPLKLTICFIYPPALPHLLCLFIILFQYRGVVTIPSFPYLLHLLFMPFQHPIWIVG